MNLREGTRDIGRLQKKFRSVECQGFFRSSNKRRDDDGRVTINGA
jgi:hypothetical protein